MFGGQPRGVEDGHFARNAVHDDFEIAQGMYQQLSVAFKLPFIEYLFLYELRELQAGRRWAPPHDAERWEAAKAMCKIKGINRERRRAALKCSKVLDARIQEEKLAYILHNSNMRPLIKPRIGHYHTMVYITYCCMTLDPANLTIWKVAHVTLTPEILRMNAEQRRALPYMTRMFIFKHLSVIRAEGLGLSTVTPGHYNKMMHLSYLSLAVNKNRALRDRYPNSNRNHQHYVDVDQANIRTRIERLITICYVRHRGLQRVAPVVAQHNLDLTWLLWIGACFDPLYTQYQRQDFQGVEDEAVVFDAYQHYVADMERIRGEHRRQIQLAHADSLARRPRRVRQRLRDAGVAGRNNRRGGRDGGAGGGGAGPGGDDGDDDGANGGGGAGDRLPNIDHGHGGGGQQPERIINEGQNQNRRGGAQRVDAARGRTPQNPDDRMEDENNQNDFPRFTRRSSSRNDRDRSSSVESDPDYQPGRNGSKLTRAKRQLIPTLAATGRNLERIRPNLQPSTNSAKNRKRLPGQSEVNTLELETARNLTRLRIGEDQEEAYVESEEEKKISDYIESKYVSVKGSPSHKTSPSRSRKQ